MFTPDSDDALHAEKAPQASGSVRGLLRRGRRGVDFSLPLILSALAVLIGITLSVLPIERAAPIFTWAPTKTSPETTAIVMPATPFQLRVETDALTLRLAGLGQPAGSDWLVFSTGTATPTGAPLNLIVGTGGIVRVESGSEAFPKLSFPIPQDGPVELTWKSDTGQVSLRAGDSFAAQPLTSVQKPVAGRNNVSNQVQITGPYVNNSMRNGITITIATQPTFMHSMLLRTVLTLIALTALLWAMVAQWRKTPRPRSLGSPRWTLSDTVVAVGGAVALVLMPPLFDDGWVLTTVRQYTSLGYFSNYYSAQAVAQPQGFWWDWLQHLWLSPVTAPVLLMRLPSILLLLATWWVLRRHVLDVITPTRWLRAVRWVGCLVALVGIFSWAPTLRPEPLICLLTTFMFSTVVRYTQTGDSRLLMMAGVIAAAAVTTHQTGMVAVLAAAGMIPTLVSNLRGESSRRTTANLLLLATAICIGLTLVLTFTQTNFGIWSDAVAAFSEGGVHSETFVESARIGQLSESTVMNFTRQLDVALLFVGVFGFLTRKPWSTLDAATTVGWSALAATAGLAFTTSKWIWHLGAITPIAIVLCSISAASVLEHWGWSRVRAIVAPVAILIAAFFATRLTAGWSRYDAPGIDWLDPNGWQAFPLHVWFWVPLITLLLAALWLLRRKGRLRRTTPLLLAATTVTVVALGATCMPLVIDGVRNPQSSWAAITARSLQTGSCGISGPGGWQIPTVLTPLVQQSSVFFDAALTPSAKFGSGNVGAKPPLVDETQVGVYTTPVVNGNGTISTPWFTMGNTNKPIRFWMQSQGKDTLITVRWLFATGKISSEQVRRADVVEAWDAVDVTSPSDVVAMQVRWNSSNGPASITQPAHVEQTATLTQISGSNRVWNNADTYLASSCYDLPSIATGRYEPFRYSVGLPSALGGTPWNPGAVFTELACQDYATLQRLCIYQVASPKPDKLSLNVNSVS